MSSRTASPVAPNTVFGPFALPPAEARPAKGGLWREEVLDRAGRLRVDLELLARGHAGDPRLVIAWEHVADAVALTGGWVTPSQWWSGSRIEDCWRRLRQAEEAMFDLGSPDEVLANVHEARNHAMFYLGEQDSRTKDLVAMLAEKKHVAKDLVPTARIALAASHESSDRQHRESRSFINTLRVVILLLAVSIGALLVAVKVWDLTFLPQVAMVPQPGPVTVDPTNLVTVAPTGLATVSEPVLVMMSQPVLVGVAVLFGALGAMFSAIPSLAQMPSKEQTFNPVRTQAVLKVVVGSWSAVIGLMAVSANLTTADTSTLAGFAMVAAIFGAGQEALTRFADRKARDLGTPSSPAGSPTS